MFVNNYYKLLALMFGGERKVVDIAGYERSISGSGCKTCVENLISLIGSVRTSYNASGGVVFGDGTVPVTMEDYKLSGNVITGIACTTSSEMVDNNGYGMEYVYTITNNNNTAITIGEICLCTWGGNGTMVDRTLLDAPITIEAGGVGQVTYTLNVIPPTA